ncbi:hypothetical protein J7K42_01275 [bacterium]|nr:hypothetical protein [bacterium]
MLKNTKIFIIGILTLAVIPLACQAFSFDELFDDLGEWLSGSITSTQVVNKINVSTNSGETTINGEVKEGETKSQVFVKNIINGKEIEPIEIESEANEVRVESEIKTEKGKAIVYREIQIDSEKTVEDYEVGLNANSFTTFESAPTSSQKEGILKESTEALREWWSDFARSLKSFFQNIFNIFK